MAALICGSKSATVALVALVALPLGGCPPPIPEAYSFYNNSRYDFRVEYANTKADWSPNTALTLRRNDLDRMFSSAEKGSPGRLELPKFNALMFDEAGTLRRLQYSLWPTDDLYPYMNEADTLTFQIESDLSIYVVKRKRDLPAVHADPQPAGYPVRPDVNSN